MILCSFISVLGFVQTESNLENKKTVVLDEIKSVLI